MRLCRFSAHVGLRRRKFTDAIPYDSQSLNLSAANLCGLKHLDPFYKLSDDLRTQLPYVCMLTHKGNKAVYIHTDLLLGGNAAAKI